MKLFLLFLVVLACGCPPVPPPDPPPPPDPSDTCAGACKRMRDLRCPGSGNTPEGATCEDVCENIRNSGIVSWNLRCRSIALTCKDLEHCDKWTGEAAKPAPTVEEMSVPAAEPFFYDPPATRSL